MKVLLVVLVLLVAVQVKFCMCDDFPSLLTANASIAIILDREYLDNEYEDVLREVKVVVERILREDLKNGGLIVSYYSWTRINLRKDFTAVFSITNCENTWEIYKESRTENLLMISITDPDCPRLPYGEAIMVSYSNSLVINRSKLSPFAPGRYQSWSQAKNFRKSFLTSKHNMPSHGAPASYFTMIPSTET